MKRGELSAANTQIWTKYLSAEWDSWTRATRLDSTRTAERAAAMVSAFFSPWLTLVTRAPQPTLATDGAMRPEEGRRDA